jgi:hypothetical protein
LACSQCVTLRSDNDSNIPRTVTIKNDNCSNIPKARTNPKITRLFEYFVVKNITFERSGTDKELGSVIAKIMPLLP